jgi:hypothetical protein
MACIQAQETCCETDIQADDEQMRSYNMATGGGSLGIIGRQLALIKCHNIFLLYEVHQ